MLSSYRTAFPDVAPAITFPSAPPKAARRPEGFVASANLVVTFNFDTRIPIAAFVKTHPCSEYDSSSFASIKIHLYHPSTTALVSASGRIVLTGSKTIVVAYRAAHTLARLVSAVIGRPARISAFRPVNRTATTNFGRYLDQQTIIQNMRGSAWSEKSKFPCCFVNPIKGVDIKHIVSLNGVVICTGGCTERDVLRSMCAVHGVYARNAYRTYDPPVGAKRARTEEEIADDAELERMVLELAGVGGGDFDS